MLPDPLISAFSAGISRCFDFPPETRHASKELYCFVLKLGMQVKRLFLSQPRPLDSVMLEVQLSPSTANDPRWGRFTPETWIVFADLPTRHGCVHPKLCLRWGPDGDLRRQPLVIVRPVGLPPKNNEVSFLTSDVLFF